MGQDEYSRVDGAWGAGLLMERPLGLGVLGRDSAAPVNGQGRKEGKLALPPQLLNWALGTSGNGKNVRFFSGSASLGLYPC